MTFTSTLRIAALALLFLALSALPVSAGNTERKPKQGASLSCPVNASAGKKAQTRTTHIRKKGKPARKAAATKPAKTKPVKQQNSKPAKAPKVKSPKPVKQGKTNNFKGAQKASFKSKGRAMNHSRSRSTF